MQTRRSASPEARCPTTERDKHRIDLSWLKRAADADAQPVALEIGVGEGEADSAAMRAFVARIRSADEGSERGLLASLAAIAARLRAELPKAPNKDPRNAKAYIVARAYNLKSRGRSVRDKAGTAGTGKAEWKPTSRNRKHGLFIVRPSLHHAKALATLRIPSYNMKRKGLYGYHAGTSTEETCAATNGPKSACACHKHLYCADTAHGARGAGLTRKAECGACVALRGCKRGKSKRPRAPAREARAETSAVYTALRRNVFFHGTEDLVLVLVREYAEKYSGLDDRICFDNERRRTTCRIDPARAESPRSGAESPRVSESPARNLPAEVKFVRMAPVRRSGRALGRTHFV
jgi:hypothetical protein